MRKTAKKITMTIMAVLIAGCLPLIPNTAFAQAKTFPGIMDEAFPPFKGEGPVVEGAAKTGGMIGGTTAGVIAGFPLGIVGAVAGAPFDKQREGAYAGFMIPTIAGQAVGQYTLGAATYLPKKILFDAPKAFFDVISAEDEKYRK
ncbi:MAG: hypothetical protein AB7S75_25125 [Desulfococcaceae bacterium]